VIKRCLKEKWLDSIKKIILEILIAAFVGLIEATLTYILKYHGTIESMGIPMVKPFLIFGSPPFLMHKLKIHDHNLQMHRKLGKTYGKYVGRSPFVFTIDPDLIKEILVNKS